MPISTRVLDRRARERAAAAPTDGTREVKLIGLRRAIAQKMQLSKRHIPHFTYVEEVDVTEMVALREELNRQYAVQRGASCRRWRSPSARSCARWPTFPQVNARFDDEAGVLTLYDAVHLGVATQTDGGLMVPVLRQAQTLDLWDCSPAIAELAAEGARRQGHARRALGLDAHRHQPGQARRHRLDAGDQPPRGGDRRHQPHRRAADGARRRRCRCGR